MNFKQLTLSFLDKVLPGRSYIPTNGWVDFSSRSSVSGITISESTALSCVAYWACVRLLSETLASLPLIFYRRLERGKERATDHPLYKLLHDEPNPEMDSFSFTETLMSHLVTTGNCYAFIDWEDYTTVKALWIMRPDRTSPVRDSKGEMVYKYQSDTTQIILPGYAVWHIPGLGYDGLIGYSPLTMAREAIGLSLATEKTGARLFGNGMSVGGILQHPNKMSEDAQKRLKKAIEDEHAGVDKSQRLLVLEEGMKYEKNTIPPEDAQFLETRKFQRNEIASFFHIPPHMIGDLERATFSNIEHQALEFVVYTMRPWLVRWEKSIKRKLLLPSEKEEYFAEFLIEGLLRGDSAARSSYYKELYYLGAMSPNDIREKENMNPIKDPAGDEYFTQQNMIALSALARLDK
ncbi:phage portal protein [Candidatus Pacearchaeota archaeon]|nr:phage portal protein [Candidatus Pacearchaeota archaeon]